MRGHAHVEDHIRRLKDSGLCRFPFSDLDSNWARLTGVCVVGDLVRWFQLLSCPGPWPAPSPRPCAGGAGTPPPASCATPDKSADQILDSLATYCQRTDDSGH